MRSYLGDPGLHNAFQLPGHRCVSLQCVDYREHSAEERRLIAPAAQSRREAGHQLSVLASHNPLHHGGHICGRLLSIADAGLHRSALQLLL